MLILKFFMILEKKREYDILLAGKSTIKHYPLRYRLFNLIQKNKNTELKKYKIYEQNHPDTIIMIFHIKIWL